ncbi:twin-arginine translocase subunit TatC [Salaquimonas pukyongi]|uniref:twin-arginine translocase subunit TatC n=1 Tax=Salaquimonas pukyongi TaxID=2712698 RepID=UPI00096B8FC6
MSAEDDIEASSAPLIEHLIELRQRLMKSVIAIAIFFVICFIFADRIFNILIIPYQWGAGTTDVRFIYTALEEYFFTQLKIALFGSLFISFPVIATQLYGFIAPGLYKNERRAFLPFLVATPVLFLIGSCLVYFLIMPLATQFFLSQQQIGGDGQAAIENLQAVSTYLGLIMTLIFAFGLVFQLPVAITLLARVGLTNSAWLKDKRKYAVLLTFVAAAVLTPPDPISQIGLAVPTLLLYEISIYMARMVEKQREAAEAASDTDADGNVDSGDVATK